MPTSCKEALSIWQERQKDKLKDKVTDADLSIPDAKYIGLQFMYPPIEKMDNSLSMCTSVEKLSVSTNMIEKIAGIANLKNLKILSVGRNYIKNFSGLEGVADTLEELWISYNLIEKVKGIGVLKKLKVLYMSNNLVKEWGEYKKLDELPMLEDLLFLGNPLQENLDPDVWRNEATKRLPNLKKLDGEPVVGNLD